MDLILLLLSGGVDSACMLHHYLVNTRHPVHAHHISIMNSLENRWQQELTAVQAIVAFCRERYRPFGFSRTAFDCRELPRYIGWDSDLYFLAATRVAPNLDAPAIRVAVGWTADDLTRPLVQDRMRRRVPQRVWEALRDSVDHGGRLRAELEEPLVGLAKADILGRTPPELLRLAWACRRPVYSGGRALPCGVCHACQLLHGSMLKAGASGPGDPSREA